MNIGQIARNQQLLYSIATRNLGDSSKSAASSSASSKLSDYSGLIYGWGSGTKDDENNFFSTPAALQGSYRQIAQRLYNASFSPEALAQGNGGSFTQGIDTAGGDPILKALREKLGAKVESLQQFYQPDQTTLSDNFAQMQALAESLVSRLQTVSLSDETTKKIQELALTDVKNSAGAQADDETNQTDASAFSLKDRLCLIQEEIQKFAPSKRAAAFNTMNKVWENEIDRIGAYIKEKDPNWVTWGDKFDASILDDYKPGVNMWV